MKKFVGAVTFLAGILVGAFLIYMTLHKSVSDEFDKKEATYRSAIGLLREDKARTSRELSEATDEKRALELKLANLHRELGINEVELKELREENKRLKTLIARHEAQSSGSTDHSATPKAQTEEGQKTND
jgi:septal ring factor EnvC (AmiA/AmiB activator)